MIGGREKQTLAAAVRQLQSQLPDADPAVIVRAVLDAQRGLSAFGYRADEQSVSLITTVALTDPHLQVGSPLRGDRSATGPASWALTDREPDRR